MLQHIDAAGLKLNLSKCHFRQTELSFLGHVVSHTGLKPDPAHVVVGSTPTERGAELVLFSRAHIMVCEVHP